MTWAGWARVAPAVTRQTSRYLATLILLSVAGSLAAGCRKHGEKAPAGGGNSPAASPPATGPAAGRPPGATLAVAGELLDGRDPAAIRAYLQSVKEIQPAKLTLRWNPATVAVSRDAAMRSLQAISEDGSDYTFSAAEPAIAGLRVGSILWIWDIAIRRVDSLSRSGDVIVAHTGMVPVTQIWTDADIEFHAPVSLPDYYMSYRPHHPKTAPASKVSAAPGRSGSALFAAAPAPQISLASYSGGRARFALTRSTRTPGDSPARAENPASAGEPQDTAAEDDWGQGTPATNGFNGEIKGFEYSLAYDARPNGVSITLEAKKKEEGEDDGKLDKEKYDEAAEKLEEANKDIEKTTQQLEDEKKDLETLDDQYEKQLTKLESDQAHRNDPGYQGPKPPPRKTDSNGMPLSDKAERDLLKQQYDHEHDIETAKMQEVQKLHDEAEERVKAAKATADAIKSVAKHLFEMVSENLDVRFKAHADLDDFAVDGVLSVANGDLDHASAQFKNLNGTVTMDFIGRMGDAGDGVIKLPLADVPIAFNLPIPIAGIPFMVQLGADFNLTLFLAGKHATMKFDGKYSFNGSGGFSADQKTSTATSTMSGGEPAVTDYAGMSPGVSGGVLGIQAPRVGFGIGLLGTSSVAYIDVVNVMTMTNSASVAIGLATPPCKRITYLTVGHVGVETNVLPLPIPFLSDAINDKLSTKKNIFNHEKEVLDPPIKACEIK